MAIDISKLRDEDLGRTVFYYPQHGRLERGFLKWWNDEYVFVKFKNKFPEGHACSPKDVSFGEATLSETFPQELFDGRSFDQSYKAIREAGGNAWDAVPNVADAIAEIRGVPQSVDECVEQLVAVLDKIEDPTKKRDAIDDAIHRLNFERRWALLSDEQRDHMCNTSLTQEQRKALWEAKEKNTHDALIAEYARSLYFRKAAWVAYLNGEGDPPVGE